MTDLEWLRSNDLWSMEGFIRRRASVRKLLLFGVACCRRAKTADMNPLHELLIRSIEQYADGQIDYADMETARDAVSELSYKHPEDEPWGTSRYMISATVHAARIGASAHAAHFSALSIATTFGDEESPAWNAALESENSLQCDMLRDIIGCPSRPFRFDAQWLAKAGRSAADLAWEIDQEGRYEDIPSLGILLSKAGCKDPAVLSHCKEGGLHVRGCWLIDALLGREPSVLEAFTTEQAWRQCVHPLPLLHFLASKGTTNQWRQFAVACCRRIDHLITDVRSRRGVEVAARFVRGKASDDELTEARNEAMKAAEEAKRYEYEAEAEEGFCMTPRYSAVCMRLWAAHAAWSALALNPRVQAEEYENHFGFREASSCEYAIAAITSHLGSLSTDDGLFQGKPLIDPRPAELSAQADILRELFAEFFGPPGDEGAWISFPMRQERWCILPKSIRSSGEFDTGAALLS